MYLSQADFQRLLTLQVVDQERQKRLSVLTSERNHRAFWEPRLRCEAWNRSSRSCKGRVKQWLVMACLPCLQNSVRSSCELRTQREAARELAAEACMS